MHAPKQDEDPTIYEVLTDEHEDVAQLLTQLAEAEDAGEREALFAEVRFQLERHAQAEEVVFYDLLRRDDEARALVERAQREHAQVRETLAELDAIEADDGRWGELVAALTRQVTQHVEVEERDIFAAVRGRIDDDQARTIAETFEATEDRVADEIKAA